MADHAISSDPAVQRQLDRLGALSPGADILGLERIARLLERVGSPQRALPPVLHVAGTNGKGSTCAFLRAAIEAAGMRAHVYSSPHLVRFNERIRLAGELIPDALLAPLLEEVLDAGGDIGASFFEVTTAAAFLGFARVPADALILEVGLGGRLDATNVVARPAVTGIAQLGIDHQAFLGDTLEKIAAEKAGIAKPGVPLVTMRYAPHIAEIVAAAGAPVFAQGAAWDFEVRGDRLRYSDARGAVETPLPALAGPHQPANLALAIAMLRHQQALAVPDEALGAAPRNARWPARMQKLGDGPLLHLLPPGSELWLDGGHNEAAAAAVSATLAQVAHGRPVRLVLGMLANKDAQGLLAPFAPLASGLHAVPVPGHEHHAPARLAEVAQALGIPHAAVAPDVPHSLGAIAREGGAPVVLVMGSLYLAGTVLDANGELPTQAKGLISFHRHPGLAPGSRCLAGAPERRGGPFMGALSPTPDVPSVHREPCFARDRPPSHFLLMRLTINSECAKFPITAIGVPMTVSATLTALPELQPEDPGARLLLFGVRQMGAHGIHDACTAHAFVTAFGKGFRRPLVLLRALMQEMSATSAGPIQIAPWCCARMTGAESALLQVLGRVRTQPQVSAVLLADMLGVRDATGVLITAHALANSFADMGLALDQ